MSGAASDEDQPDDMVTVESDAAGHKVFHIEPTNADPEKRHRYTRAEVNARMDRIAESLDAPDRLMQQLSKNSMSPALTEVLAQNESMTKFMGDMIKSPTIAAFAGAGPFDKIAKRFVPPITTGIDWERIVRPVSAQLPGMGLSPDLVKGLDVFAGSQTGSWLDGVSRHFDEAADDLDELLSSKFAGVLPASSPMGEWQAPDYAFPDLPPSPVHETNALVSELVEIIRAEREDHLRDQQRDAEALAEQKRKNAQDRALLRISERRRRADAWKGWVGLGAGLVGAVAGVLALFL